jgi:hypothetical protein
LDFTWRIDTPFAPYTIDFTRFHTETKDLRPYEISPFQINFYGFDDILAFEPYLLSHNFPDVTFSYGFSITSMDYDHGVPEPGTLSLLLMGGGGAWLWRRRRDRVG